MSRTKKGSKGPGHEYWSRRSEHRVPGKISKLLTVRKERREGKEATRNKDARED